MRIAVAAEDGGKDAADLLVAKLDGQPGLESLERVDLGGLSSERQFDFQKAETRLSVASSVLLMEAVNSGGQDFFWSPG